MVSKVVWLKRSVIKFEKIVLYLQDEWTDDIAKKFHDRVYEIIDLIKDYPELGIQISQRKVVRRILITKQNYLVYRIFKSKLIIVNFIDTRKRQN